MLPDAPPPHRRIRWRWIAVAAILAILVGLAGAALAVERGWLGETDVELEPAPPGAPALTAEEWAYYDYVIPRLRELAAQARALATLGEEKSRDLFEIQARGQRLDELIDEIAVYGREHGVPERFAPVSTGFAEGARLTRQAMADSRQGMARFDWDQVAQAVPVFLSGADRLEATAAELERLGGAATPVAETGRRVDG